MAPPQVQAKTLKQEKERRHHICRENYGDDWEWGYQPEFYNTYNNLQDLRTKQPFKLTQCRKFDAKTVKKDPMKRYYKMVSTQHQCDLLNGYWDKHSRNRDNLLDDGVCWVRADDRHCAAKHDNTDLIAYKRRGEKGYIWPSTLHKSRKGCIYNDLCDWQNDRYECFSKEASEELEHTRVPGLPSNWPSDITRGNIQEYIRQYYLNLFDDRPQSYMPIFGRGNRCVGYQKLKISQPQTVVNMIFKGMAERPSSKNRGLLIWHSTGSGKTCTAAGVMESFWDTDKEIIFVSSVEALASNPPEAFMKCAENLFPRFRMMKEEANSSASGGGKPAKSCSGDSKPTTTDAPPSIHPRVREAFEKRGVKFFTFAQLAHYLLINKPLKVKKEDEQKHRELLKNAILIIDEVHNIFKPLPHQKAEHFALRDFLTNYSNPLTTNLNIAVLTATPGDSPEEIVDLLNMVRDRRSPPIKVPTTKEDFGRFAMAINGLVSYFHIGSDMSKYPFVNKQTPHKAAMSMTQYKKYIEAFESIKPAEKNFDALVEADKADAYYKPARKYSNMLFNFENKMSMREFSSKLPILFEQIAKYPKEKHYIYSVFFENRGFGGHGILAIAKILEKEFGYERVDFKMARDINEGRRPPLAPGKKRYMLAITNELVDKKCSVGDNLQELVKLFNRSDNKNGEYVQLFLASQKFNEGVDFKAVRHVHILEPFLSYNKELQTIGRGARYCSHRDLNIDTGEWVVNVHKYLADFPIELKHIDIEGLRRHIEEVKKEIADADSKLFAVKGKRGKEFTDIREQAKKEVSQLRATLAEANKNLKEALAVDPKKYFMIDQKIEEEVAERLQAQTTLLYVMKMMAVDCELFRAFHAQSGDRYSCANPESSRGAR